MIMTTDHHSGVTLGHFSGVDASGEAELLLGLLESREQLPQDLALRRRACDLLQVRAGDRVADVGCGVGRVVAELRERGIDGIGVDLSQQLIARARHRFAEAEFRVGTAEALPFVDGELGGYLALRLYSHLADPAR